MVETWKPVVGYESMYEVSNLGAVRSLPIVSWNSKCYVTRKEKVRKQHNSWNGYLATAVGRKGSRRTLLVHRLVCAAFHLNPENKPFVNHKNGIKTDNRAENLEWCTRIENMKHAFSIGLQDNKGENHPTAKLTEGIVRDIRKNRADTGEAYHKTATKLGISKTQVMDICNRKSWNHI